ncbi:MAG: acetyl-CoA hydrolase/transferase family protein [Ignavibacteriales bacterium]
MSWQERYKSKLISADEAAQKVKSGDIILTGLGFAEPSMLIPTAISARRDELEKVTVGGALQIRPYPWYFEDTEDNFIVSPGWASKLLRNHYRERRADFVPMMASTANPLLLRKFWKVDVGILMVTAPDKHGWCNLGLTNFYSKEMIANAKLVIAETNEQMPTVYGDNWVHIDDFDLIVENSSPIPALPSIDSYSDTEKAIAEHIAPLIKNRDNLQLGIGGIPSAIINLIKDREDLGIVSEMLPLGLPDLVEKGVVTNKFKNIHKGVSIATFCIGDQKMYDFVDHNPGVGLYPSVYTNGVDFISRHRDLVSINAAIEIDLKGQVTAESIGSRHISGAGGQFDFVMGTFRSENGRSIMVLPSTRQTSEGLVSTIVPTLQPGATVTVQPYYTQYVCTEHGIVDLTGQSWRTRANLLISIAHPDFRVEMVKQMKNIYYSV